ncbi:MAG: TonB-dependent receptor [Balneolaceae bacterium]|nr:MAG: TonB-dependent receptor [Balneolaceae bacterium]
MIYRFTFLIIRPSINRFMSLGAIAIAVLLSVPANAAQLDNEHNVGGKSGVTGESGDSLYVAGLEYHSLEGLSRQQSDRHFGQILSAEQLQLFNDTNLEQALARFTGVQVGRDGQFNIRGIRGVARGQYNVTLDGQRMATTGAGNRSIDLGSISLDAIHRVEIRKVLTPDQDADAMSGVVSIETRKPASEYRQIDATYGSGFNNGYKQFLRPDARASANFSQTFGDNISFSAGVFFIRENTAREILGVSYDLLKPDDAAPVGVVGEVHPGFNIRESNSLGGRVDLRYRPSADTEWHVSSYVNTDSRAFNRHRVTMRGTGDIFDPDGTGEMLRQGSFGYDIGTRDQRLNQFVTRAGLSQRWQFLDAHYRIGWAHSSRHDDEIGIPFLRSGITYALSLGDPVRPRMELPDGPVPFRDMRIEPMSEVIQEHRDNTFTAHVDLDIPVGSIALRVGGGTIYSMKSGDYRDSQLRVAGLMDLSRFQMEDWGAYPVLNQASYEIPSFVKAEQARAFFERNYTSFRKDNRIQRQRSDIWNYDAIEGVYSGYAMATANIGIVNVLGGARIEHTSARYEGYDVLFDDIGNYRETVDTSASSSYTNIFPNVQFALYPFGSTMLQMAYSRSIARPDYHELTPFRLLHIQDQTIFRGNTSLGPIISDNLDLMFEYTFRQAGSAKIGLFYKNLQNFVVERTRVLEGGEFDGFTERTFANGERAAFIYGIELTWQQKFHFLPGVLGNLGTYTNYTWSLSRYRIDGRDPAPRLPGQSPQVVNVGVNYEHGRFFGQVSYHWTAESIVRLESSDSPLAAVTRLTYPDHYEDGFRDLSVSARFRLSEQFLIWADASNLIPSERVQYIGSRSRYVTETQFQASSSFHLGLRYSL